MGIGGEGASTLFHLAEGPPQSPSWAFKQICKWPRPPACPPQQARTDQDYFPKLQMLLRKHDFRPNNICSIPYANYARSRTSTAGLQVGSSSRTGRISANPQNTLRGYGQRGRRYCQPGNPSRCFQYQPISRVCFQPTKPHLGEERGRAHYAVFSDSAAALSRIHAHTPSTITRIARECQNLRVAPTMGTLPRSRCGSVSAPAAQGSAQRCRVS